MTQRILRIVIAGFLGAKGSWLCQGLLSCHGLVTWVPSGCAVHLDGPAVHLLILLAVTDQGRSVWDKLRDEFDGGFMS